VGSFPLKELHGRKATSPLAKPEQYYATSPQATLPRSGFVRWARCDLLYWNDERYILHADIQCGRSDP
jgi:hypothetical protein